MKVYGNTIFNNGVYRLAVNNQYYVVIRESDNEPIFNGAFRNQAELNEIMSTLCQLDQVNSYGIC